MTLEGRDYFDVYGNLHRKETELGRGGQGVVFRTSDPDLAVKLVLDGNGRPLDDPRHIDRLRRIRTLPIPSDLHLSMPIAVLRDTPGYVMRLLREMVPFKHFWHRRGVRVEGSRQAKPKWLAALPDESALELLHYVNTGGLRRRLLACYKTAVVLARLHAAGLVYGDVSPANVYVSSSLSSREVWLIDADNLRFELDRAGPVVYTPRFGAPELVQRTDGCRQRTDCHAFAVLAFWFTALKHPFIGSLVEAGDGSDWADDAASSENAEERAYAGALPWIDNEDDDSNAAEGGLPRVLVFTPELRHLFHETFGPGRLEHWRRPLMFHWPPALARALDRTVACPECRMAYYYEPDEVPTSCPYCGTGRPGLIKAVAAHSLRDSDFSNHAVWTCLREKPASPDESVFFPQRLFRPFSLVHSDNDVLELSVSDAYVLLRPTGSEYSFLYHSNSAADSFREPATFSGPIELPREKLGSGIVIQADASSSPYVKLSLEAARP